MDCRAEPMATHHSGSSRLPSLSSGNERGRGWEGQRQRLSLGLHSREWRPHVQPRALWSLALPTLAASPPSLLLDAGTQQAALI